MVQKRFIQTKNFKIGALEWGKGKPKKVLALHGWLDNANSFLPLAPYLKDFHVVAIDLIGHGHSEHRPKSSAYHFIDAVTQVFDVMEALKWKKCSLLGHSMGGGISSLAVPTMPEKFESLVLIEALGPFSRLADESPAFFRKHLEGTELLLSKRKPVYKKKEEAALARKAAGDFSIEAARLLCDRGLKKQGTGWTWRADPKLRIETPIRMTEDQVLAFIKRIQCPTLLIRGLQGLQFDPVIMSERRSLIKNLKYVEVEGGHHLHMEQAESLGKMIGDFLG